MARKEYRDAFIGSYISGTISSQIASLREKKNWTQTDLANRAGMRQSRISALEDPNYENFEVGTLRRIAAAFDVGLVVKFVPFSEIAREAIVQNPAGVSVVSFDEDSISNRQSAWSKPIGRVLILGDAGQTFGSFEQPEMPAFMALN